MLLPPSHTGAFHDKARDSVPILSTTGNLGGSGRSVNQKKSSISFYSLNFNTQVEFIFHLPLI